jgi:hypothetical protein
MTLLAEFGNKQLRSLKSASAAESDKCPLIGELISREQRPSVVSHTADRSSAQPRVIGATPSSAPCFTWRAKRAAPAVRQGGST